MEIRKKKLKIILAAVELSFFRGHMSAKQLSAESFVIQLKAISFQKGKEIELQKTTLIRQLSENPPRKPAEDNGLS